MSTSASALAAWVLAACQNAAVATQAGVAALVWSSATYPHVMQGLGSYYGHRNRGRLPFVEFDITGNTFQHETEEGGTILQEVTLRANVPGVDKANASALADAITDACLVQIRTEATSPYAYEGSESVGPLVSSPIGHSKTTKLIVRQSFDRATYDIL